MVFKFCELVDVVRAVALLCVAILMAGGCAMPSPDLGAAFSQPMRTSMEVSAAQKHFARGEFGLAEKTYRKAVERDAHNPEAWLGLAASYDQLARFDMADRSYRRARDLMGETPILLNNRGYSYMLRGDLRRAKKLLARAQKLNPSDQQIARNIEELNLRLEKIGQHPVQL